MSYSRRTATRRDVRIPCQVVREDDFRLLATETLDVSVEGMLLPVSVPVEAGQSLIVSFPLPGIWIDAEAVITRVIRGMRPSDDGPAFGVLFTTMSSSSRAALAGYLHGRPPPLPRRGPFARLRRGAPPPRLADQALMDYVFDEPGLVSLDRGSERLALEHDIQLEEESSPLTMPLVTPRVRPVTKADHIDGRAMISALVGAWRDLSAG